MNRYNRWDLHLKYNLENLHFFTKEYIARQYQKLTVKPLPEKTTLPSFHLFVDERDMDALESDLPASARLEYKQSYIKIDKPEYSGEAQFRYRGGLDLHWLYDKKSIRVKVPPFSTYRGERQFNLVNPSTIHTITDWLSYDMARSIGLLTPEYFPARVFINNETNGLHFFLSKIDESFLRKNNRMPGSIYSGDTLNIVEPFGANAGIDEAVFRTGLIPNLWTDERIWQKEASRSFESTGNRDDIKFFIKTVNETDPLVFMSKFETHFDKEKFYYFWALDKLVGSYHHDLYHNHRIYFDPYIGKFEPIEWDIRFWSTLPDIPVTPFFEQILLNPILRYEHDRVVYELWGKFNIDKVFKMINDATNVVKSELAADPYRQHPDPDVKVFRSDKVLPFTMSQFEDAIKELKQVYAGRHKLLEQWFNSYSAQFYIESKNINSIKVSIIVAGDNAIDFNPWDILPESEKTDVEVFRVINNREYPILNKNQYDRLYPGITIEKKDVKELNLYTINIYGDKSYSHSPIIYQYLIKGTDVEKFNLKGLTGKNAITGKEIIILQADELPDNSKTNSLHPWDLLTGPDKVNKNVVLSGEISIDSDRTYTKEQTVIIQPGTKFKMSENASLFFYGKVFAKGTENLPIKFERKEISKPWGSIVIQGESASGSILKYIDVKGGTVTENNMIYYPGQLNIHDVALFELGHCIISDNSIGDDALHVAYSQGKIHNCKFKNTAFDALDMDIVNVSVTNSSFSNIGNDAIDLMSSKSLIRNVKVNDANDKCISIGENSEVSIELSDFNNCQYGLAIKDESVVHIENINFSIKQGSAIAMYQKNPRYGNAGKLSGDKLFGISKDDIDTSNNALLDIPKNAFFPHDKLKIDHAIIR